MSNPYDDTTCKIQLYKTLIKLVTNHHWNMSPPLEYSILLLSNGQTSNDPRISSISSTALSNLNSFIHPTFATLQFPLDMEGLKNEFNIDKNSRKSPTPNHEASTECEMEVIDFPSNAIESVKENTENSDKENEKQIESSSPQEEKKDTSKEKITNETVAEKETMDIDTNTDQTDENEQTKEKEQNSNKTSTDDIIEIPEPKETQRNEKKNEKVTSTENENSSRTSYSVHIEILSDDEIMEQLTIEDEPENLDNSVEKENAVSSSNQGNIEKNNTENVIDLVEEDMCSAFVDIVNE